MSFDIFMTQYKYDINLSYIYDLFSEIRAEEMDLKEYLFRHNVHVSDFAKEINYSRQHLSGVIHGTYRPGKKLAEAIEKATNGEVKAADLLRKNAYSTKN